MHIQVTNFAGDVTFVRGTRCSKKRGPGYLIGPLSVAKKFTKDGAETAINVLQNRPHHKQLKADGFPVQFEIV